MVSPFRITLSALGKVIWLAMTRNIVLFVLVACSFALLGEAFSPALGPRCQNYRFGSARLERSALEAKRKRRRKQPPGSPTAEEQNAPDRTSPVDDGSIDEDYDDDEEEEVDLSQIVDVAKFKFEADNAAPAPSDGPVEVAPEGDKMAIPLPDIKEALRKKELQEELARIEEEESATKVKIKRNDRKALAKLLEQQPYADADDSFFEEEAYGTVSALLGERALPFLGIPTGPLQVGHLIGALVIVLMAFVEYPGFPLTNLPSPLRGALQGGLLTVYSINAVLAVLAVFKAGERGQPAFLWIAKTFTVGGIAFDQLTQLPTLEEIAAAKARKGKRALKKKK